MRTSRMSSTRSVGQRAATEHADWPLVERHRETRRHQAVNTPLPDPLLQSSVPKLPAAVRRSVKPAIGKPRPRLVIVGGPDVHLREKLVAELAADFDVHVLGSAGDV